MTLALNINTMRQRANATDRNEIRRKKHGCGCPRNELWE